VRSGKKGFLDKLTFKQVLQALEREILFGKTYLSIGKGLLATTTEWNAFGVAPTFFGLTADGSLQLAQMAIAKLYDRGNRSVTIKAMLLIAAEKRDSFQADVAQVNATIFQSAKRVIALQPILDSIRKRRDKWLAHLDISTVRSPAALNESAKLTMENLERAFAETEDIFSRVERLFDGAIGPIRFSGDDDYKNVFEHISRSQRAEMKEFDAAFEKQFGHPPPKD
jgi:hypothetical protein